ncbi:hypothetical protein HHI36_020772 [Cryptolaemus montrouzieri]|uniref:Cirhin n=1 Tax=Cryptolaemus montrouzieri TaxID=559131 RepID=A0ABD2NBA7_9CUCU
MKSCSLHNIRFYKPKPRSIYCMALHPSNNKLALSRSDATIEIWNISNSPYIERSISSSVENYNIEGLAWFDDRLFSVGLHGYLVEYDLKKLSVINKSVVTGEAAFCLDISTSKKQISIGTEQGYINIFDVTEDGSLFNKFLDKQEGRILCLKFDKSGDYIVSGGLDAIRIWNVESGHALHKITTSRSEANKPTIIWCLAVTDDLTIISGDSRGKLTFYDGKLGAQIESFHTHKADILSLCLSADQSNLYCSGVDSNIVNFVKIEMKGSKMKWVRSVHKRFHDHDVRALVLQGDKLYSGGTDAYLALSQNQPKLLVKYPPIVQNPFVTICKKARYVMLRYPEYIEIWSLAETENETDSISLKKEPKKLMVMQRLSGNGDGNEEKEGIIFCTMSDDGKWIAYGTRLGLRVFQFIYEIGDVPKLLRVENIDGKDGVYLRGMFTPDSSQLIATLNSGIIEIFDISNDSLSISQRLEYQELKDTVSFLLVSDDGNYLVAADCSSNIVVWQRNRNKSWGFYCKLPLYSCAPTAINLHPKSSDIIVVYADNKIIEFSLKRKSFTSLTKELQHSLPKNWSDRLYTIKNIFHNPSSGHIILHDDNSMMAIDLKKKTPTKEEKKRKLVEHNEGSYDLRVIRKYKHLVYIGLLSEYEMVCVGVNPLTLLEQLPPILLRNKFGTK